MRLWLILAFFVLSLPSLACAFDIQKQMKTLDFAKSLDPGNEARLLPTYRNLLETLGATSASTNSTLPGERRPAAAIVNGASTIVERDSRTLTNFAAVSSDRERVWLGVTTKLGAADLFPDSVAIKSDQGALCSGVLVAPDAVVTAGHCFCRGNTPKWVIFGTTTDIGGQNARVVAVKADKSQAKMQCGAYADGDVGVVALAEAVDIPFRKVAPATAISNAKFIRVVGFGQTETGTSGSKLMVDVPVTSADCKGSSDAGPDASVYGCYPEIELVASSPLTNANSCKGDSGGGAYVLLSDGSYALAAVVSRGIKTPSIRPCGDGGIYPRLDVASIKQWLAASGVTTNP